MCLFNSSPDLRATRISSKRNCSFQGTSGKCDKTHSEECLPRTGQLEQDVSTCLMNLLSSDIICTIFTQQEQVLSRENILFLYETGIVCPEVSLGQTQCPSKEWNGREGGDCHIMKSLKPRGGKKGTENEKVFDPRRFIHLPFLSGGGEKKKAWREWRTFAQVCVCVWEEEEE